MDHEEDYPVEEPKRNMLLPLAAFGLALLILGGGVLLLIVMNGGGEKRPVARGQKDDGVKKRQGEGGKRTEDPAPVVRLDDAGKRDEKRPEEKPVRPADGGKKHPAEVLMAAKKGDALELEGVLSYGQPADFEAIFGTAPVKSYKALLRVRNLVGIVHFKEGEPNPATFNRERVIVRGTFRFLAADNFAMDDCTVRLASPK